MKSSLFVSLFVVLTCIYSNGNARYLLVDIDDEKERAVEESEGTFGTPYHHHIFSMCLKLLTMSLSSMTNFIFPFSLR